MYEYAARSFAGPNFFKGMLKSLPIHLWKSQTTVLKS